MNTKGELLQKIARLRFTLQLFDEITQLTDTMSIEEQLNTYKNAYKAVHKMLDGIYATLEKVYQND